MHLAAQGGSLDVIKYLLPQFGVRVHDKGMNSYTMLHWAAQMGHCQVALYLIETMNMDPQDRDKVCLCVWEGGGCQGRHVPKLCCKRLVMPSQQASNWWSGS